MKASASPTRIPAVFIRGGTSKGVFFHAHDLPADRAARDQAFIRLMGSPDPYQRQLDGMGGGLSSVSKVVVIAPSDRPDADVDYTFVQIAVDAAVADYAQTCGNLSSAVGPFAVEEGLVEAADGMARVRVYNTNTDKTYHASFMVRDGHAVETGDFQMAGVPAAGAAVRLDYLDPGGAKTAGLLPTGSALDGLRGPDGREVEASLVDASNPLVFLDAAAFGLDGTESPDVLDGNHTLLATLDAVRRAGAVRMGIAGRVEDVPLASPSIALLAAPLPYRTLAGEQIAANDFDVSVRVVSMQRPHRAVTATGAMCLAAAAEIRGSLANRVATEREPGTDLRIGTPSGVVPVAASVSQQPDGQWHAASVSMYRTQRRLMEGSVVLPRE